VSASRMDRQLPSDGEPNATRTDRSSPIFGMPIVNAAKLNASTSSSAVKAKAPPGIVNALFYAPNCSMGLSVRTRENSLTT
jgi:NAD/NADP transhydrogenase beta subunit